MTRSQRCTGRPTAHTLPAGRRLLRSAVVGAVMIGIGAVATPASATHPHVIETPGTCVDKAGAGFGTGQDHSMTFPPTFHTRVHDATPDQFAFAQENNPVRIVGKTLCP